MTALTQLLVPAVTEANSILFQLCSRGDMQSSGATRPSDFEFTQSVMTLSTCEHQWEDRTGSDADHDVQDVPFNKHRWTDDKNTVSIHAELDEMIATSERAMNDTIGRCCTPMRPNTRRRNGSVEDVCW